MLGKWIDSLTDEERDRIVTGADWRAGAFIYQDGARCLVGHARGVELADVDEWVECFYPVPYGRITGRRYPAAGVGNTARFDRLVMRFGLARIVRACKLRAGATLPTAHTPPAQPSTAARTEVARP